MQRRLTLIALALAAAAAAGCATLADAQAAKGTGTAKIYDRPHDAVWSATLDTVKASGLALVSQDKATGRILAQGGVSAFSYGENVAIFVEEAGGKGRTRVEVVNKRAVAPNITAANWERRIFEALDQRLR